MPLRGLLSGLPPSPAPEAPPVSTARHSGPRGPLYGHNVSAHSVATGVIDGQPVVVSGGDDGTVAPIAEVDGRRVLLTARAASYGVTLFSGRTSLGSAVMEFARRSSFLWTSRGLAMHAALVPPSAPDP